MDKVLLSSSLPKPSSIKEEEVGDFSDMSVEDDAESNSPSDVFLAQQQQQQQTQQSLPSQPSQQPSPKVITCKKSPHFSLASKSVETTLCSSPVSSHLPKCLSLFFLHRFLVACLSLKPFSASVDSFTVLSVS